MTKQKVGIIVECMCDLPKSYLLEHNIDVIYFLIKTEYGIFMDTDEVTADNIVEYMETNEKMPVSSSPDVVIYERFFRKNIKQYDEVIFIASASGASTSYGKAEEARQKIKRNENIHIFDSKQLSGGIGHIVMRAVELAEEGLSAYEIISELTDLRERISTSFMNYDGNFICKNGYISKGMNRICNIFGFHPVTELKNGSVRLHRLLFGNYDKASMRYVRKELKNPAKIDKKRIFITYSGCPMEKLERIKAEIRKIFEPEEIIVMQASASLSCRCRSGTFGIMFVQERKR